MQTELELHFFFQIENLEHVNPATVSQIGLLCMTREDVGWQQLINRWIRNKQEREAELLRSLCDRYIGPTLEFLSANTSVPPRPGAAPTKTKCKALERAVFTSEINMIETLIALVEVNVVTIYYVFFAVYLFVCLLKWPNSC